MQIHDANAEQLETHSRPRTGRGSICAVLFDADVAVPPRMVVWAISRALKTRSLYDCGPDIQAGHTFHDHALKPLFERDASTIEGVAACVYGSTLPAEGEGEPGFLFLV